MNINGYELKSSIPEADLDAFATAAAYCGLTIRGYSGRSMFGNETVAASFEYEAQYQDLVAELPKKLRRRVRTDSLGMRSVAYLV